MKKCSKCQQTKPLDQFYGTRPDCKECKKASSRKNYEENRDHYVEYSRQYRRENYQQTLEAARRYRAAHLAERREYEANYNRDKLAARSSRVARIKTLIAHFEGRGGWLELLAKTVAYRPDAYQLSWLSRDVDELLCVHYYKEQ